MGTMGPWGLWWATKCVGQEVKQPVDMFMLPVQTQTARWQVSAHVPSDRP